MPETCANCGRTIGKLETGHIHNDQVVCEQCRAQLQAPGEPPATSSGPSRSRRRRSPTRVPTYTALQITGTVITTAGVLGIIGGIVVAAVAVAKEEWVGAGLGGIIAWAGLCQAAMGEGVRAFRDLCRNSWG